MNNNNSHKIYNQFRSSCLIGDSKIVKKMIYEQNVINCIINKDDILRIISGKTDKYRKILKYIASKCININIDDDILLGCFGNGWDNIAKLFVGREDIKADNIKNNDCIIKLLKFNNDYISNKVIRSDLDYMGKNEAVMLYLCSHGKTDLVKKIVRITVIDPNYNNGIFLRAGAKYKDIINALKINDI